jgi:hypothetical protein
VCVCVCVWVWVGVGVRGYAFACVGGCLLASDSIRRVSEQGILKGEVSLYH